MSSQKKLLTIPTAMLQKLRCALCNNYLNHFPVYTCKDIGTVCGRCPFLQESNPIHNDAYEIIAGTLTFPCIYTDQGCVELLTPHEIAEHEETCTYRQYFCPFMPSGCCPWQGPSAEILDHFLEKHKIFVLENGMFEIDFTTKYSENYILPHNYDKLFIIHKKCDIQENLFWCSVSYVGAKNIADQYVFELQLIVKGDNTGVPYIFPPKAVQCFVDPNLDINNAIKIDANIIKRELNNPANVICNINIEKKAVSERPLNGSNDSSDAIRSKTTMVVDALEQSILSELDCPVCYECMVPPIYQCETGHSVCDNCKPKITECPLCKLPVKDTRNFGLEKITGCIKYYCKYRDFNCSFNSSVNEIKQHEALCKFGPYNCPFQEYNCCSWKGNLNDIMEHARFSHSDNVLETDTVNVPFDDADYNPEDTDSFILEAHDELFKLLYKYGDGHFYWSVQLIGPPEESNRFMYMLDIIDNTNTNQRFILKRKVSPLLPNAEAFEGENSFIKLPMYVVEPMIDNDFTYRIHIV